MVRQPQEQEVFSLEKCSVGWFFQAASIFLVGVLEKCSHSKRHLLFFATLRMYATLCSCMHCYPLVRMAFTMKSWQVYVNIPACKYVSMHEMPPWMHEVPPSAHLTTLNPFIHHRHQLPSLHIQRSAGPIRIRDLHFESLHQKLALVARNASRHRSLTTILECSLSPSKQSKHPGFHQSWNPIIAEKYVWLETFGNYIKSEYVTQGCVFPQELAKSAFSWGPFVQVHRWYFSKHILLHFGTIWELLWW